MTTNGADETSDGPKDDKAAELELLKQQAEFLRLGYTRCTIRYNEIYASVWSIFSFLAAGTGAFLGFAKEKVGTGVLILVPLCVVAFWYLVVFNPLNRYGNKVAKDAARLEAEVNRRFFGGSTALNMFVDFELRRSKRNRASGLRSSKWRTHACAHVVARLRPSWRRPTRQFFRWTDRVEGRLFVAFAALVAAATTWALS